MKILRVVPDSYTGHLADPSRDQRPQHAQFRRETRNSSAKLEARQGCVELVGTRQRRGATEHFYRGTDPPYLDDEFWSQLSGSVRSGITLASLRYLVTTARDSLEAGLFEARADRHFSIASYDLDEQAWAEARDLYHATLDGLMDLGAESETRIAAAARGEAPTPALRATFGLLAFESPGTPAGAPFPGPRE